jgi:hypothetical protein
MAPGCRQQQQQQLCVHVPAQWQELWSSSCKNVLVLQLLSGRKHQILTAVPAAAKSNTPSLHVLFSTTACSAFSAGRPNQDTLLLLLLLVLPAILALLSRRCERHERPAAGCHDGG